VKLLLDKKAEVSPPKEGATQSVVRTNDKDIVRYMLEHKVDVHCDPRSTVQFYAKLDYEKPLLSTLTTMRADVQASKSDASLLHLAVHGGGDGSVVSLLLDSQADVKESSLPLSDMTYRKGRQGVITLVVHRGTKLPNLDMIGKQDPYCILKCGSASQKTKVHKSGGSIPVWNETFTFDLFGAEDSLDLEVWDEDFISDDEIGKVKIPLSFLLDPEKIGHEMAHKLYKNEKERGEIYLTATFKPWFPGTLTLTVHSGENLTSHELIGEQSPFVQLFLNGAGKQSTKVHDRGGRNPQWNEAFHFHCVGREMVTFKVWDKETVLADDFIGGRHLAVSKLQSNSASGVHHYAIFEGSNYDKKLAGSLSVSTMWSPDAVAVEPIAQSAAKQDPHLVIP